MLSHRAKAPIVPVAIKARTAAHSCGFAPPIVAASVVSTIKRSHELSIRINEAISDALTLMLGRSYAT